MIQEIIILAVTQGAHPAVTVESVALSRLLAVVIAAVDFIAPDLCDCSELPLVPTFTLGRTATVTFLNLEHTVLADPPFD